MSKATSSSAQARSAPGFLVERPRAVDAVGGALRAAFAQARPMPADMTTMLARIDRPGDPRR